ncbi:hypothetical protein EUZ87_13995 [Lactiplantibacillus paraplantarum]|uniref:Uncharacterized protein n=1 Tax=Lactiplantibacillus paraplantarum TaxID=60520 RepID=A0A4Q9XYR8_9LACO|nr:hypothetical protein EUZ87_13995 [Lactiplantibacillus paraplantarum]
MVKTCRFYITIRSHVRVLVRPPGLGANCRALQHRFEPVHNPPGLKYESYSKPKADHFQLRITWHN